MQTEPNEERRHVRLSDEDFERIIEAHAERSAKREAEIVTENVYMEVGKGSIRAFILVVGSALVALGAWFGILPKFFDK